MAHSDDCTPTPATPARTVYLDYAAATPIAPEVLAAMAPYYSERFYNPSAPYSPARLVRAELEEARAGLAHAIGGRPANIVLTAGATEANNLAISSSPGEVLVSAIEHESVLEAACAKGCSVIGVGGDGRVDQAEVDRLISPRTGMVSIALANGEVGTVQPMRAIASAVRAERERRLEAGEERPIWLHTDASQAAGSCSLAVSSLGVDLMTISAAKVYGPKQVGLLWASDEVKLVPLVRGGGQERGLRSGTENVAGAVGFSCALNVAIKSRRAEARRLQVLRDVLQRTLLEKFPWAVVSGPVKPRLRLPGLLHISFPGLEARRLVIALERKGVYVGTGSACAANRMRTSHVLSAIGLADAAVAGSLRITLGRQTDGDSLSYALRCICEVVGKEAARVGIDPATGAPIRGASHASVPGVPHIPTKAAVAQGVLDGAGLVTKTALNPVEITHTRNVPPASEHSVPANFAEEEMPSESCGVDGWMPRGAASEAFSSDSSYTGVLRAGFAATARTATPDDTAKGCAHA